jgi:hypothetical protein
MGLPRQTGEIFEILSKGLFICSNGVSTAEVRLYEIIFDNFEELRIYFEHIGFILERGDEFFYFSRKDESKADLERKLEAACRWIDILDFLKAFDNSMSSGALLAPHDISVCIDMNPLLRDKVTSLRSVLRVDDKLPYPSVVEKMIKVLCDEGFAEVENETLKTYKLLSSFKYIEELVSIINIPEEAENEMSQ